MWRKKKDIYRGLSLWTSCWCLQPAGVGLSMVCSPVKKVILVSMGLVALGMINWLHRTIEAWWRFWFLSGNPIGIFCWSNREKGSLKSTSEKWIFSFNGTSRLLGFPSGLLKHSCRFYTNMWIIYLQLLLASDFIWIIILLISVPSRRPLITADGVVDSVFDAVHAVGAAN